MKKEQVYVEINNEQERLRAIEILWKARENYGNMNLMCNYRYFFFIKNEWLSTLNCGNTRTKITLDQLEEMLMPKQLNVDLLSTIKQIQQHLQNDYPKGTEIKISNDKIEIYQS